jgi:hypothetical protein
VNKNVIPWSEKKKFLGRISHITSDWLTPVDYLPYIDALLGDIDLDPCSTHHANAQFLRAKTIYTIKEDGLNIQEPWKGKTYLFPPTYGRCSFNKERGTWRWSMRAGPTSKTPAVIWFGRLVKEWKLRNVPEALFYTTNNEMLRVCQDMWEYPVCIPKDRANLVQGKKLFTLQNPLYWGHFIYLPPLEFGFEQVEKFRYIFSHIGKVIC